MPSLPTPRSGVLPPALRARALQLVNFGLVGGLAFVVDVGVYNLLRLTVLDDKPIGAKVASVAIATVVAWLGNRHLTFRAERSGSVVREGLLFAVMNVIGLLISAACLFVSHYILGFTSPLADNIAGNIVGLVLGMVFRFTAYRYVVFRPREAPAAAPSVHEPPSAHESPALREPPSAAAAPAARREPARPAHRAHPSPARSAPARS